MDDHRVESQNDLVRALVDMKVLKAYVADQRPSHSTPMLSAM